MSLRILKLHLQKVCANFLKDTFRPLIANFKDEVESKRARGHSMEVDPKALTSSDNLQQNVKDITFFAGCFFDKLKQKVWRDITPPLLHNMRKKSSA